MEKQNFITSRKANKLTLNLLAASVLMGLSFSVAATLAEKTPTTISSGLTPADKTQVEAISGTNGVGTLLDKARTDLDTSKTDLDTKNAAINNLTGEDKTKVDTFNTTKALFDKLNEDHAKKVRERNEVRTRTDARFSTLFGTQTDGNVNRGEIDVADGANKGFIKAEEGSVYKAYLDSINGANGLKAAFEDLRTKARAAANTVTTVTDATTQSTNNDAVLGYYYEHLQSRFYDNEMLKPAKDILDRETANLLAAINSKVTTDPTGTNVAALKTALDTFTASNDNNRAANLMALVTAAKLVDPNIATAFEAAQKGDTEANTKAKAEKEKLTTLTAATPQGATQITDTITDAQLRTLFDAALKAQTDLAGQAPTTAGETKTNFDSAFATYTTARTAFIEAESKMLSERDGVERATRVLNGLIAEADRLQTERTAAETAFNTAKTAFDDLQAVKDRVAAETDFAAKLEAFKTAQESFNTQFDALITTAFTNPIDTARTAYTTLAANPTATQEQKNQALYTLIATSKDLIPQQLAFTLQHQDTTQGEFGKNAEAQLQAASKTRKEAEDRYNAARDAYNAAKAKATEATRNTNSPLFDNVEDGLAYRVAEEELLNAAGHTPATENAAFTNADIADVRNTDGSIKDFKEIFGGASESEANKAKRPDAIRNHETVAKVVEGIYDRARDIRFSVLTNIKHLDALLTVSTATERTALQTAYQSALNKLAADTGSGALVVNGLPDVSPTGTYYLGGLTTGTPTAPLEEDRFTDADGLEHFRKFIVEQVDGNFRVKRDFTSADLAGKTGTPAAPLNSTVLNIQAPSFHTGNITDRNTLTVGGVTGARVGIHTSTTATLNGTAPVTAENNGAAVRIAGDLLTTTPVLDENGAPTPNTSARGADLITIRNADLTNVLTRQMLDKLIADLNKEAADAIAAADAANPGETPEAVAARARARTDAEAKLRAGLDAFNARFSQGQQMSGLRIDSSTKQQTLNLTSGEFENAALNGTANISTILISGVNITVINETANITGAGAAATPGTANAIQLTGSNNNITISNSRIEAQATGDGNARALLISGKSNLIEISGNSTLIGDIRDESAAPTGNTEVDVSEVNTVNLTGSTLIGNVFSNHTASGRNMLALNLQNSQWTGGSSNSPDVALNGGVTWNVLGSGPGTTGSSVNSLTLSGLNTLNLAPRRGSGTPGLPGLTGAFTGTTLTVEQDLEAREGAVTNLIAGGYNHGGTSRTDGTTWSSGYSFGQLHIDGLAKGNGKFNLSLPGGGGEPVRVNDRLANALTDDQPHAFISYLTSSPTVAGVVPQINTAQSALDLNNSRIEAGIYQYQAVAEQSATDPNRTNVYFKRTDSLSNSAATAAALAAAPSGVTRAQQDALDKHLASLRHSDGSGVWIAYYGGKNNSTLKTGPEYGLKTNGVLVGVDAQPGNGWLAGIAFASAKSKLDVLASHGEITSYGAQFYLSRRYDNGVFVDSSAQFNHFSNTARARMTDGTPANGDYATSGYGLSTRLGYAWAQNNLYAEPYLKLSGGVFTGAAYSLTNDLHADSTGYKSLQGEIGADLGYHVALNNAWLKPYLNLAVLNEFATANRIQINTRELNNSVSGAAFRVGIGAELKLMENLGGYTAFDYTKGSNTERPWQIHVGVNYTW